jgi:succinoglycan biosynthesis protein ExoA
MSNDDVLVVVPCLNEADRLPALLRQLLDDTGAAHIVVTDGGSTDGSIDIVSALAAPEPRLSLMNNPARIQSAGINGAVRQHARGARWLLRVDAHCGYPQGYLDGAVRAARAHDATSVVVPMVSRGVKCFQRAAAAAQNSRIGTGGSLHRHVGQGRFVDHGHHALMDRELFEKVGGYREDMSHNEDAELDLRLAGAGGRIWLEPALALTYFPRATAIGLWRQYWQYGQGRRRTLQLHRLRPKIRQLLPLAVPIAIMVAPLALWQWIFILPLAAWSAACLGMGIALGVRAQDVCAGASGAAAMIMHAAWGFGYLTGRKAAQRA